MKKQKNFLHRKRTLSRLMAVQSLYQFDFYQGQEKIENIIENIVENYSLDGESEIRSYKDKVDKDFLQNLVINLLPKSQEIDEEIKIFLQEGWELAQLPDLILFILRCACFEFKFSDVPAKVVINEYVDIAAAFYETKKITFVNSILENLAKKFRASEFK